MVLEFLIQGSATSPYKVTFQKNDNHIYAGCDCAARKSGIACKHIFNVLDGDVTEMVKGNNYDIKTVLQLCAGTRFIELYYEYKSGLKKYNTTYLKELKKAMITKPE